MNEFVLISFDLFDYGALAPLDLGREEKRILRGIMKDCYHKTSLFVFLLVFCACALRAHGPKITTISLQGFGGRSSNGGGSGTSVGRQGTLSGRLRSVSDLEKSGLVTSSEKGRLKDLIISGDESLRSALEK